jgi:hypothetical protein
MRYYFVLLIAITVMSMLSACEDKDTNPQPPGSKNFSLENLQLDNQPISYHYSNTSLTPEIVLTFSERINPMSAQKDIVMTSTAGKVNLTFSFSNNDSAVTVKPEDPLKYLSVYNFSVASTLASISKKEYGSTMLVKIVTGIDPADKFPAISDAALLDLIQRQTLKYFFDFAHPASGMARERNSSGNTVTTGGTGFGIMALIVGMERNFITRQQGLEQLTKILTFLETADRLHGAWPHWIDGNTGKVIPFSTNDNGGDLVETSFLMQGLITMRQYLSPGNTTEMALIDRINNLWKAVEWSWYTKGGENVLYWHWSPDKAWTINHQIKGYNEALITYVLAASSPNYSINTQAYHSGWAENGNIKNGKKFYDITLPLGYDYGGPLFFSHYSFLGIDPRNLTDTYANYWMQNVSHSLINYNYVVDNPKNYAGYSEDSWGLTASDNHQGYSAHSPTNDLGVISPTAALSSFPYTPEQSMKALKFFYYKLGDKLWGPYGFYDAYNLTQGWVGNSYLAIDQGPIIIMIENYRSGLLWNLFMSSPEVKAGLTKLSFTY